MPLGANKAAIMGVAGVSTGDVVLIQSQTADSDSAIAFTSGITSTYGEYIFKFYNINPETQSAHLTFQVDDDVGNNGYNDFNITSSSFYANHTESDSATGLQYWTDGDLAQSTDYQWLMTYIDDDASDSAAGELHLFNPSSSTYVKHFYSIGVRKPYDGNLANEFMAGYINTTTAINAVNFKMSTGDFEGKIKMWGVK